ncbi:MAG: hypothetical protein EBY40_13880 [Marivivens sp.]|nr:hypothetical protein [Marivivens sp.]
MKTTVNEYEFVKAFDDYGRGNNFSRLGRSALYDYLTDLEEDCGIEFELDVIALCCEFTEYESLEDFRNSYGTEYETLEDVMDMTQVIAHYDNDESFIAQDF